MIREWAGAAERAQGKPGSPGARAALPNIPTTPVPGSSRIPMDLGQRRLILGARRITGSSGEGGTAGPMESGPGKDSIFHQDVENSCWICGIWVFRDRGGFFFPTNFVSFLRDSNSRAQCPDFREWEEFPQGSVEGHQQQWDDPESPLVG